jgi:hypothetical protein
MHIALFLLLHLYFIHEHFPYTPIDKIVTTSLVHFANFFGEQQHIVASSRHLFSRPFHLLISFFLDGFFDAGMLLSALKAKEEDDTNVDQRDVIRRNIGRRLKLAEY